MGKKALLVISFGTSYPENRAKTIGAIEKVLQAAYPDYDFYLAFTARMIIKKLKNRNGEVVDTPLEALERLKAAGYEEVVCQTTHVINGYEYDLTLSELRQYAHDFKTLTMGVPLLTTQEDFEAVARILAGDVPELSADEACVFMGHGTDHHANSAYPAMDYYFKHHGYPGVFMGTVEGFPELSDILPKLEAGGYKRIHLMPFMIVAGDHAQNDMAGDDEESWKSQLMAQGYEVVCHLVGIGENKAIQEMFVEHAREAKDAKEIL
ncbi:sirohydrochlorin cobaltochelatase [Eubacterium aggregans]|uniref:sirohydrochlorin cobaltochelatase n=1 Tax=Eubacterium aggregans TaxID=81409 RepID=UPI003F3A9D3C